MGNGDARSPPPTRKRITLFRTNSGSNEQPSAHPSIALPTELALFKKLFAFIALSATF